MIEIRQVSKGFEKTDAVRKIDLTVRTESVFGLLGTNGAGKSTLLRMMAGVLKPDGGEILIDGEPVWDNPAAKGKCFYISDDQFFFPNATALDMAKFYGRIYTGFDDGKFKEMMERFSLDGTRRIRTFSKGMKKQLAILLALCTNVPYIFCDETFDGLDPVMRQAVKSIFAREIEERGLTPVIASHNLRELEDICDYVGLLHAGGVLLARDLQDLRGRTHKVLCVLPEDKQVSFHLILDVLQFKQRGRLISMTVRGEEETIRGRIEALEPVYMEILPLTLEEIFISETEVIGYDIKKLIL